MEKNIKGDWVECALGELCKFSQGVQVPKNKQFKDNDKNRVRFLRIIDFTQGNEEPRYIEKPNEINIVSKEDISMVRYGTVGFVCTGMHGAIANNLFRIIPQVEIEKKYLISFLDSGKFKNQIVAKGATMQALNFGIIKPIKVPFPPLPIQRAIVAKIEELFSSLDSGIADLEKAQKQLVVYRQAVLKKAFEGEFSSKAYNVVKINSICEVVRGGSPRPAGSELYYNGDIPFMKVKDISRNNSPFISVAEHSIKTAGLKRTRMVKANTLLLTNSGATLGIPAITTIETTFNDGIAAFLNLDDNLLYHYYYWVSKTIFLQNLNQGAAQPNLNTSLIGNMDIPIYLDKNEHSIIVREIESRLSVCDKVEESIVESLEKAKLLRQSILKKAFEGKLLSEEEIEKCKREKDYEPAHILLERIRSEKKKKK